MFWLYLQGDLVDLYVPRKCAATGRIIEAKDHASVQIAVADVDANGRMIPGQSTVFPLSGFVRQLGEGDDSLNRLAQKEGCKYCSCRRPLSLPTTLRTTAACSDASARFHQPVDRCVRP